MPIRVGKDRNWQADASEFSAGTITGHYRKIVTAESHIRKEGTFLGKVYYNTIVLASIVYITYIVRIS